MMPKKIPFSKNRQFGVLVSYNEDKGFGFIRPYSKLPESVLEKYFVDRFKTNTSYTTIEANRLYRNKDLRISDIFVHVTDTKGLSNVGQWLSFEVHPDPKKTDKYRALKVYSLEEEISCWENGDRIPPAPVFPALLRFWLEDKTTFFDFWAYSPLIVTLEPDRQIAFLRKAIASKGNIADTLNDIQNIVRYSKTDGDDMGINIDYNIDLVISVFIALVKGEYPSPDLISEIMFKYIDNDLQELPQLNSTLFDKCVGRTVQNRINIGTRKVAYVAGEKANYHQTKNIG